MNQLWTFSFLTGTELASMQIESSLLSALSGGSLDFRRGRRGCRRGLRERCRGT
jgi:hypothetical protein